MKDLPRTANGKFSREELRRLLAARRQGGDADDEEFVEPHGAMERLLVDVAVEVLGVEQLSMTANLTLAGLTPLKAMRLVMRLHNSSLQCPRGHAPDRVQFRLAGRSESP